MRNIKIENYVMNLFISKWQNYYLKDDNQEILTDYLKETIDTIGEDPDLVLTKEEIEKIAHSFKNQEENQITNQEIEESKSEEERIKDIYEDIIYVMSTYLFSKGDNQIFQYIMLYILKFVTSYSYEHNIDKLTDKLEELNDYEDIIILAAMLEDDLVLTHRITTVFIYMLLDEELLLKAEKDIIKFPSYFNEKTFIDNYEQLTLTTHTIIDYTNDFIDYYEENNPLDLATYLQNLIFNQDEKYYIPNLYFETFEEFKNILEFFKLRMYTVGIFKLNIKRRALGLNSYEEELLNSIKRILNTKLYNKRTINKQYNLEDEGLETLLCLTYLDDNASYKKVQNEIYEEELINVKKLTNPLLSIDLDY